MPKAAPEASPPAAHPHPLLVPAVVLLLIAATVASYLNSLNGPFIFDDVSAIYENPTIRDLGRIGDILNPPNNSGVTVNGRPLVNLTLAINYAAGGTAVFGYHVVNVGIHTLAALAMFGVVRRLHAQWRGRAIDSPEGLFVAAVLSTLWTLHPLQTQSVTYVIQRAEALVGLFYLTTLYAFIRSQTGTQRGLWSVATVVSCLLGVASKEVIVSAPITILLCDRAFFSGTFAAAWRRNRYLHLALFACWLPLAWQIHAAGGRGGTVGFGIGGVTSWIYLCTQADALTRYFATALWPARLVFDYGTGVAPGLSTVLPQALLVVGLLCATLFALVRTPRLGFLAASFFLILAPSSSFVPIVTESMAEHRMYLPLGAVLALMALAAFHLVGRRALYLGLAAAIAFGILTLRRNRDYRGDLEIWRSAVANYPSSARAHNNLGEALSRDRRFPEAMTHYREAVRLLPNYRDALCNLGAVMHRLGQRTEGMAILSQLVRRFPDTHEILSAYGGALYREGQRAEARRYFERAVALGPDNSEASNNLAVMLNDEGRPREALALLERALRVRPTYTDALYNAAISLTQLGDTDGAINRLRQVLAADPGYPEANNNLGAILVQQGQRDEATRRFERAVQEKPTYADALNNLAVMRLESGRSAEAVELFERALALQPNYPSARANLEVARQKLGGEAKR
jgi:tetratricopeptide (TPR) repeat protein